MQRSDSSLRLDVHFHTAALDGVYVRDAQAVLRFHALAAPSGDEVAQVAAWTHERIVRMLARHGRSLDGVDEASDVLADAEPVLASCYAASAANLQLLGDDSGQRTSKLVHPLGSAGPRQRSAGAPPSPPGQLFLAFG
jgi:hypothetical protein